MDAKRIALCQARQRIIIARRVLVNLLIRLRMRGGIFARGAWPTGLELTRMPCRRHGGIIIPSDRKPGQVNTSIGRQYWTKERRLHEEAGLRFT
jgi:hypothetical protein